jgi:hypothetical protein
MFFVVVCLDMPDLNNLNKHGRRRHAAPQKTQMCRGASHPMLEEQSKHSSLHRTIL